MVVELDPVADGAAGVLLLGELSRHTLSKCVPLQVFRSIAMELWLGTGGVVDATVVAFRLACFKSICRCFVDAGSPD